MYSIIDKQEHLVNLYNSLDLLAPVPGRALSKKRGEGWRSESKVGKFGEAKVAKRRLAVIGDHLKSKNLGTANTPEILSHCIHIWVGCN